MEYKEECHLIATTGQLPSIHDLFVIYNQKYFQGKLGAIILEWSDKMTLCAGICYLRHQNGSRFCVIRLSRPLLQYRPLRDMRSTLLHEMIHAYLWLETGYLDRDGHGESFLKMAQFINQEEGKPIQLTTTTIGTDAKRVASSHPLLHSPSSPLVTVHHSFHEEVQANRKHVWRCAGPCRTWPPYYGWVRRAMNRPPQPADRWWAEHQTRCGGKFDKVGEPLSRIKTEAYKNKRNSTPLKDPIDHFTGKGSAQFVRNETLPCPSCGIFEAKDFAILNDHLDSCLLTREQSVKLDDKQCPVCLAFTTSSLTILNDHIEACLEKPLPSSKEYGSNQAILDIIDLT